MTPLSLQEGRGPRRPVPLGPCWDLGSTGAPASAAFPGSCGPCPQLRPALGTLPPCRTFPMSPTKVGCWDGRKRRCSTVNCLVLPVAGRATPLGWEARSHRSAGNLCPVGCRAIGADWCPDLGLPCAGRVPCAGQVPGPSLLVFLGMSAALLGASRTLASCLLPTSGEEARDHAKGKGSGLQRPCV